MSTLDGLGDRLGSLIDCLGISQNEFADRAGTSASFVSDITRGIKRPGSEFLHALKSVYGVSLDWLISGDGAMFGGRPVEMEFFKLVAAFVELARSARIEGDPKAQTALDQLLAQADTKPLSDARVAELLKPYGKRAETIRLAAVIYNSHLWTTKPEERGLGALRAVIAHFDAEAPIDATRAFDGPGVKTGSDGVRVKQVISGKKARVAGRDYHERAKRSKSKDKKGK